MSEVIDLQPFCETDETRFYIMKPFTRGEHTFATNGHIIVRVPKREGMEGDEKAPKPEAIFAKHFKGELVDAPDFAFPKFDAGPCLKCLGGNESVHECPNCDCLCDECDGGGFAIEKTTVTVHGVLFNAKYMRLLYALPGLKLPISAGKEDPLPFAFDGGDGLLMPMRRAYDDNDKGYGEVFGAAAALSGPAR